MAQLFAHQLQPFEENQSPSPTHEIGDPFGLAPTRSRSVHRQNSTTAASTSPVKTLHRQLSGDPDAPPPAWKRRESFTQKSPSKASPGQSASPSDGKTNGAQGAATGTGTAARSPIVESISTSPTLSRSTTGPPPARRPPNLQMTTSTRSPMPNGMFTHDSSPNASSISLYDHGYDPTFAPPQPAFLRKRGGGSGSNRSSIHSFDTNGMTSEDLWNLETSESVADLSNPQRNAMERPLDTVRRLSQRSERPKSLSPYSPSNLPIDLIWPTAPLVEEDPHLPRIKSKSTTNVHGMTHRTSRLGRKKTNRQSSIDSQPQMVGINPKMVSSDQLPRSESEFISSAHSSTTDLSKGGLGLPPNKSHTSLGARPPSTYYSRDFLSQLAPREGGYAIAAMLNTPSPTSPMSASAGQQEDKRRSVIVGSRPPTSRSAGMGRWSLDGGEHYNRPYGSTSSANTTTSNLSAPPINSPDPSPPADERSSAISGILPEGASAPITIKPNDRADATAGTGIGTGTLAGNSSSTPNIPSPLSQSTTDDLHLTSGSGTGIGKTATAAPGGSSAIIPIPPIPSTETTSSTSRPTLSPKQSKKQLAKEAKAAEKAEAAKVLAARAAKAKEEAAKKQADKDREKEMKEAGKRKEKEEKERKKAEKKKGSAAGSAVKTASTAVGSGDKLKSPSQPSLRLGGLLRRGSDAPAVPVPMPVAVINSGSNGVTGSSTATSTTAVGSTRSEISPVIVPNELPTSATNPGERQRNVSMPANTAAPVPPKKVKLGLFGTIRKRFSNTDNSKSPTSATTPTGPPKQVSAPTSAVTDVPVPAPARIPTPTTPKTTISSLPPGAQTPTFDAPQTLATAQGIVATPQRVGGNEDGQVVVIDAGNTPQGSVDTATKVIACPQVASPPSAHLVTPVPTATATAATTAPSPSRTPRPAESSDSHTSPSSSSITRARSRSSVQGPRPMPQTHQQPRSASVVSRTERSPAAAQVEMGSNSGESSGLSQVPSHLTSSSGTFDSQTPMTSEDGYPPVTGTVAGMTGNKDLAMREQVDNGRNDLGRVVGLAH